MNGKGTYMSQHMFEIVNGEYNPGKYELLISLFEGDFSRTPVTFRHINSKGEYADLNVVVNSLERVGDDDNRWKFRGYYHEFLGNRAYVEGEYILDTKTGNFHILN